MKINLNFGDLCEAFEMCNMSHHFFIDLEKNEIIDINEEIENNAEEKLESINEEKFLIIPERTSNEDYLVMELFVYEIAEKDFQLSDKFYDVIHKSKPFKRFKEILDEYPELKDKWFKFREKQIQNDVINWLFENKIILENQKLIPDIEIKVLDNDEIEKFPTELKDFGPMACMNCRNEGLILSRFFSTNCDIENMMIDEEIKRIMKEKYNTKNYGVSSTGKETILTYARCPKCGSEDIFWDF
ncbi:MAG: UPF0158 family protein [Nanoarchaeota archaeon]|nr:UPF0158 family protein [Nanoarchaeota archaeon]